MSPAETRSHILAARDIVDRLPDGAGESRRSAAEAIRDRELANLMAEAMVENLVAHGGATTRAELERRYGFARAEIDRVGQRAADLAARRAARRGLFALTAA